MPIRDIVATRANDGRYQTLLSRVRHPLPLTSVHVAVAYATHAGVAELCSTLTHMDGWHAANKQWLIGVDHCRSDPSAIDYLHGLPSSELRVHDGHYIVRRPGCSPRVSYHPKLYIFRGQNGTEVILGSGNLSYTGLKRGVEAGAAITNRTEEAIQGITDWFRALWQDATPLAEIRNSYAEMYTSAANRRHPVPLDDDLVPPGAVGRRQISGADLRKLRVCTHFWIYAGRLHKNRGPGRPGNQLMLKRNSRVYFGFHARDVDPDTSIGHIAITYSGQTRPDCSLRFSNNSMDVLTLPIPGNGGPGTYDERTLQFRRTGVRTYELTVATPRDVAVWRRRSEAIGSAFQLAGGRRWGVY